MLFWKREETISFGGSGRDGPRWQPEPNSFSCLSDKDRFLLEGSVDELVGDEDVQHNIGISGLPSGEDMVTCSSRKG